MKILIVDDSEIVRVELRNLLEAQEYAVLEAANGQGALRVLRDNKDVSCILTDYNMPAMNGLELVEQLRNVPEFEKTPVIIFSAQTVMEYREKAKQLGVSAWVLKPYKPEALISLVKKFGKHASS